MTTRKKFNAGNTSASSFNAPHRRVVQRGEIHLLGRRHAAPELAALHGETVTVTQAAAPGCLQVYDSRQRPVCVLRG